jgi:isoquinoline 1-oxidoreductase beta subunit
MALTIGFQCLGPTRRAAAAGASPTVFAPNAFLRIGADGSVTVIAKHVEMGQGAYTGIATVLAEELDADWAQVRVESAPANVKLYANSVFGMQGTGGSSAMANSWSQLREAGAKGRAMLLTAAAKDWKVPVTELTTEKGVVFHAGSKRKAAYGSLTAKAAALPVPDKVTLKDPKDFKLIGRQVPRVDVPAKVDGTALFTLDVALPGMLVALLKRPPLFGATVKSFDPTAASAVPGVVKVVQVPHGVAVVAKSFWAAKQGRDALVVDWDDTHAERRSSSEMMNEYRRLAEQPAPSARKVGDAVPAIKNGAARRGGQADRHQLRDLGRRSISNHRSGECRQDGRTGSCASQHQYAVCRRQLRPARQRWIRLHRGSRIDREGLRRRRHADQAAMDA